MNRWLQERFPALNTWITYFKQYQVPKNLNVYYCFGALALLVFVGQWLSGLWLTMFYTPSAASAFDSIESIMRDVPFGWLFRDMHTVGASAFFMILYIHLFRGLLYGSYQKPRELVWILGVLLLLLTITEAFFGQTLPWSQMSYWGAQVLTSLLGVIPGVGDSLVTWFRGDYVVGDATLHRFFALHVIAIPLLMIVLVILHIVALHQVGSNNPEGIDIKKAHVHLDKIPFYPNYWRKDLFAMLIFLLFFFAIVCFMPNVLLERNHFISADPLQTADSVTPMWYMLPYYSILRAIPNKIGGVVAMGFALLLWFCLPWLDKSPVRSMRYKGQLSKYMLTLFVLNFIFLGYLGALEVTTFIQYVSQVSTLFYFAYFIFMPSYTRYERCQTPPKRLKS